MKKIMAKDNRTESTKSDSANKDARKPGQVWLGFENTSQS